MNKKQVGTPSSCLGTWSRTGLSGIAATLGLAVAVPAVAQDPVAAEPASDAGDGRIVYDQGFFAQYGVTTAVDMLNRIPGVSAILSSLGSNSQERGFGSGGDQVLLNGRRFPGKTNDISKILSRLRADTVERVELIRGNASDIDVQSTGVVVNIILREGASVGGGGNFELNLRGNDEGAAGVDGLVNYAGSTGGLSYSLGIERNLWSLPDGAGQRWTNRTRDEVYLFPDGSIQEERLQNWRRQHDKWIYTAGASYDFIGGARLQVNGLYQPLDLRETEITPYTRFDLAGNVVGQAIDERYRVIDPIEVIEGSTEFTTPLAGGSFTALGIASIRMQPTRDRRVRTTNGQSAELSRTLFDTNRYEYIFRTQYSRPIASNLILTIGGEAANNRLTQDAEAAFDLNGDGVLENVVIPTSDARVAEWRGEGFIDAKWNPFPNLSINGSINYEYSDLTTNSIFNPGRSLNYWKPRLDIRYDVTAATQIRFLVEREVSQLDFANFVPRYNVIDDRVDAGNPGLLPEIEWDFEVGLEHRLAADAGVLEGRLFYEAVSNAIDFFPLQQGPVLVSAQGNLGDAWSFGAEAQASVRLVPIGLRDVLVSLRGEVRDSRVTDPFTGEERRLRSDNHFEFDVGFRHDVSSLGVSYGADYRHRGDFVIESDLFSRDLYRVGPLLATFIEIPLPSELTLRLEGQNLLGGHEYRERTVYSVNQIDGGVRRFEAFKEKRDLRYVVKIRGSF